MPNPIDLPDNGKMEINKAVMKKVTDDNTPEIIYQVQLDESKWACIAGDYFLKTATGWMPRKGSEYDAYFGKNKRGNIDSYFDFFVNPNHENYQEFKTTPDGISVNWYRPLSYKHKKGDWSSIETVLRHLGASEDYGYNFILDWLWLKHKYPNTKFKVTTSSSSGGSSLTVRWTDGAKTSDIDLILSKYVYGGFNSQEDMYEYSKDATGVYGEVKYAFSNRSYTEDTCKIAIEESGAENRTISISEYDGTASVNGDYNDESRCYRWLRENSFE